jgi:hypothetical protein
MIGMEARDRVAGDAIRKDRPANGRQAVVARLLPEGGLDEKLG